MICDTCEKYPCDMDGTKLWHRCFAYSPKPKPITNADRIRAMTDAELAELFANDNCGYCRIHDFCFNKGCAINCKDCWLDWLKEEVGDGNHDH